MVEVGRRVVYLGNVCNDPVRGAVVRVYDPDEYLRVVSCDVILEDGREMRCTAHQFISGPGCRFVLEDGYASEDEIVKLHAAAAIAKAQRAAKMQEAKKAFNEEVARLKAEFPMLAVGLSPKVAAANIRTLLKREFPAVKFSVRVDRGFSVKIQWTDGPTVTQVEKIVGRFRAGYFDGMTDTYEYKETPWNNTFGTAKYIFYSRYPSDDLVRRSIDDLVAKYGDYETPTVEEYRRNAAWNRSPIIGGTGPNSWQGLINKRCSEIAV